MHSRAHAFLTHPLAASSLASWQPGLATIDLVIPNQLCTDLDFSRFHFLDSKRLFGGLSPHLGTTLKTTFSPLSFGKNYMKIRSVVPENGCLIVMDFVVADGKKRQKQKTDCKTYTHSRHLAARMHQLLPFTLFSLSDVELVSKALLAAETISSSGG